MQPNAPDHDRYKDDITTILIVVPVVIIGVLMTIVILTRMAMCQNCYDY